MAKKPRKTRVKHTKFEDWELDYMANGPPDWEIAKKSVHRWHYLDGRSIFERLKKDPDIDLKDYPWAVEAFKEKF